MVVYQGVELLSDLYQRTEEPWLVCHNPEEPVVFFQGLEEPPDVPWNNEDLLDAL